MAAARAGQGVQIQASCRQQLRPERCRLLTNGGKQQGILLLPGQSSDHVQNLYLFNTTF